MEYKDLERINKNLATISIKGKDYIEVNQRVLAFRELMPNGVIETQLISLDNGVAVIKAVIRGPEDRILSTGYAYEKEGSTFINKTSYIENCETSAVGRALGFLGIGIDGSIASKEEVENAITNQTLAPTKAELIKEVLEAYTKEELASLMETTASEVESKLERQTVNILKELMRKKVIEKKVGK